MKSLIKSLLPAKLTYPLVTLKKTILPGGFAKPSFSESGEDILITNYLFRSKNDGFYVDIGCFHPRFLSNTHLLHKRGWKGMNVDAHPQVIGKFKSSRPDDINLQLGIAEEECEKDFHMSENVGASTFDPDTAKAKSQHTRQVDVVKTRCVPLKKVFEENLPEGQKIDLLDIDVEHLDYEVIKSNDWSRFRPNVILIEDREFRTKLNESKIFSFLHEQGYVFYAYSHITLMMCEKDFVKEVKKF